MKSWRTRLLALLTGMAMLLAMVPGTAIANHDEFVEGEVVDTFDIGDQEYAVVVDDVDRDCDGVPDWLDWDLDNDLVWDDVDDFIAGIDDGEIVYPCTITVEYDIEKVDDEEEE